MTKSPAQLVLLLSLAAVNTLAATAIQDSNTDILNLNFSLYENKLPKYSEYLVGSSGVIGLRRTAAEKDNSIFLLELTNGSGIVQLIFSRSTVLLDCDVSNSKRQIRRLTNHISSKYHSASKHKYEENSFSLDDIKELTDLSSWIERCYNFHDEELESISKAEEEKSVNVKSSESRQKFGVSKPAGSGNGKTRSKDMRGERESPIRKKRGLVDLIYPGTKWCGKANSAKYYHDLGENKHTDRCCRAHDHCPDIIVALSTKYNYFNFGIFTVSRCSCDLQLKKCLKRASKKHNDSLADMIGQLYFDFMDLSCFNLEEEEHCASRSYWGYCLETERKPTAVFNEEITYVNDSIP